MNFLTRTKMSLVLMTAFIRRRKCLLKKKTSFGYVNIIISMRYMHFEIYCCYAIKVKVCSNIALGTVQSALQFTPWHTCSSSQLLWKAFMPQLLRRLFVHTSIFIAMYLFIHHSELWQRGVNETVKASIWQQEDLNMDSLE